MCIRDRIGEVLKLSESATKSLLFRAYEALREDVYKRQPIVQSKSQALRAGSRPKRALRNDN